jgi:hypothetical protein
MMKMNFLVFVFSTLDFCVSLSVREVRDGGSGFGACAIVARKPIMQEVLFSIVL